MTAWWGRRASAVYTSRLLGVDDALDLGHVEGAVGRFDVADAQLAGSDLFPLVPAVLAQQGGDVGEVEPEEP